MKLTIILSLLVFLNSCGSSSLLSKTEMKTKFGYNFEAAEKEFEKYGAQIIYDDTEIIMDWNDGLFYTFETTKYIHYFNEKAEKYTHFKMTIDKKYWKFLKVEAATILPNGEIVEVSSDDMKYTEASDGADEEETLEFSFPQVQEGAVFFYKIKRLNRFGNFLSYYWDMDYDIPMFRTAYQFRIPKFISEQQWTYDSYYQNVPYIQAQSKFVPKGPTVVEPYTIIKAENRNILPVEEEKFSLPKNHLRKYVQFYPINSKERNWIDEIYGTERIDIAGILKADDEVKLFIKNYITHDSVKTNEQIISKSIEAIQSKFKIKYKHAFDGGRNMKDPNDTAEKIGEEIKPREANALLTSVLRKHNINAKLAYLKPFNDGHFLDKKIDFWELRNTLVFVPQSSKNKQYWINLLPNYFTKKDIHYNHQGVTAFVLEDNEHKISYRNVTRPTFRKNASQIDIVAEVDKSKALSGTINMNFTGTTSHILRSMIRNSSETKLNEAVENYIKEMMPNAKIENINYATFNKKQNSQKLSATFKLKNFVKKIGRSKTIEPFFIKDEVFISAIENKKRFHDIHLRYPSFEMTNIKIKLPNNMKIDFHETNVNKRSSFMDYSIKYFYNPTENVFSLNRVLQKKKNIIKRKQLKYIKEISDAIAVSDRKKLKIQ